ncbi:asparaginase [Nocardiopsis terrae]|uniref:L-asparaginase II n=1 Tax=Nocardiopsis terrae TaxID=372655 RepID=A0ABR9HKX7_9ACTN|nr:asparaginase [Nocardiopsis terrae]MBE1459649.1 L-asparaginase II [Nocardiopsis terrae]GHC94688.1 asparaginase [Nocardiopsis terrae]
MNQAPLPSYAPLAEVVRSGMREGVHYGAVVGLSAEGEVAYARGPVHDAMFPRSSAKPFQALAALRAGAPLEGTSLAIAAGSHGGEDFHAAETERILAAAGLTAEALRCPPAVPGGAAARKAFLAAGRSPERRYMNCSGKHAGMLAACVAQGWSTDDYLDPEHPLQVLVREATEDMCGERIAHTAVDGCGAPQLAVSLVGLARGIQGMRLSPEGSSERTIIEAMSAHPEYVSGTDRIDTELMTRMPGLVSKIGADGVLVLNVPTGETVAVKISDGDAEERARVLVGLTALRGLGVDVAPVKEHLTTPIQGGGRTVGEVRGL